MTENRLSELEQAQALLESHGWKVDRPPFDDPYEVMYRRMLAAPQEGEKLHPDDDPLSPQYDFNVWDRTCLAFLKKHFVLKTEVS
jgi:hypothetical protein